MNPTLDQVQKVTVVGLGKTGVGLCKLLSVLGKKVTITECKKEEQVQADYQKVKKYIVHAEFGGHSRAVIRDSDLIVVNPSVPLNAPVFQMAKEQGVTVIGEIEACFQLCKGTIIAVTGSIGKTTTTSLIFKIVKKYSGRNTYLLGNIGIAFSEFVLRVKPDDIVCLEVSSYQLGTIRDFRPHIAVLLNLVPNHLDVHAGFEEYRACKLNIFKNQTEQDFALVNARDKGLFPELEAARAQKCYFTNEGYRNENFAAAILAATLLGIEKKKAEKVIESFKGLPHRLEHVETIDGVAYVNDSKSTTVESTIWALEQTAAPVILICGGRDKGLFYDRLIPHLKNVKHLYMIGEAREKIAAALASAPVKQTKIHTLQEAFDRSAREAVRGDTVLLSCMCSSFDMFKDYKERGNVFKKLVRARKK